MKQILMGLKILLPFEIFLEKEDVSYVLAETTIGSFGILPQRLDCVAAIEPGILTYKNKLEKEKFIAIDEGILIKTGLNIMVSVRRAISGKSLEQLRISVDEEFLSLSQQERKIRQSMEKMESSFVKKISELKNERR